MNKNRTFTQALEINIPFNPESKNPFKFPSFHLIIEDTEEGLIGFCLDFGATAFSLEEDKSRAELDILLKLIDSSIDYVFNLYNRGIIDKLYVNKILDPIMWENFALLNDQRKINNLKRSLAHNSIDALDKNNQLETISNSIPFSNLPTREYNQLIHIMTELSKASTEEAKTLLSKMINAIFKDEIKDRTHLKELKAS
jgi:hypothetical protein